MSARQDLGLHDHWHGFGAEAFPATSWCVHEGVFEAVPEAPRVDLVSRACYGDFTFEFEWALPAGGNSGVLYRVRETAGAAWQSGPEMQLLDDARHPDGREPTTRCGALYGLLAPRPVDVIAADRFIAGRIVVSGWRVEHWLGPHCVLACDLSDPELRERIACSKFKDFPTFAQEREGHVVLQHHGDAVRFRHLRIERG
ncbi:DUF1080 domain-containing protein [Schlegelella sp. S2-27]|uniref:DUF1080 domain-containing protein n=1 Tax=Caldimonas mangrovi TaxID=2944811 RepID=A0ABT0YP79_9BURK|nr:DUF1080 domain-containing protein [Caldimonas mangrovi]MCM5680134.1 DUF1080 domain-containing protein [Caldimonas mangrovi]